MIIALNRIVDPPPRPGPPLSCYAANERIRTDFTVVHDTRNISKGTLGQPTRASTPGQTGSRLAMGRRGNRLYRRAIPGKAMSTLSKMTEREERGRSCPRMPWTEPVTRISKDFCRPPSPSPPGRLVHRQARSIHRRPTARAPRATERPVFTRQRRTERQFCKGSDIFQVRQASCSSKANILPLGHHRPWAKKLRGNERDSQRTGYLYGISGAGRPKIRNSSNRVQSTTRQGPEIRHF